MDSAEQQSHGWHSLSGKFERVLLRLMWLGNKLFKDLLSIVIMVGFMKETLIPKQDHWQVLDFFAGFARITKLAKGLKLAAACVERDFSQTFDLNTSAGFVLLAAVYVSFVLQAASS